MTPGIILECSCALCKKEFSAFSTGLPKLTDTIENVMEEVIGNIVKAHKDVSPDCKGTEDDIVATNSHRALS